MGLLLDEFPDFSELTRTERNILSQLDSKPELIKSMNLPQLAAAISASNTSIIRLAQKLGYSGFTEFRYAMLHSSPAQNMSGSSLLEEFKTFSDTFLTDSVTSRLDAFVLQIYKSAVLYIAGTGSSKMLAEYFVHKLTQVDRQAVYVYDNSLLDLLPNVVNRRTLVIYISTSGETPRLVNSAQKVKETGAAVYSITNCRDSSLAHLSKVNIATQTGNSFFHNYDFSPKTFQMAVIDLILEHYIKHIGK